MQENPGSTVVAELLSDQQAAALMGVSCRKFHEIRHEEWMPKPIVLGPRFVKWSRSELLAAISNAPRQEAAPEPAQLLRGRIEKMKRAGCAVPA
ncbi:MAG: hypothetical protein KIT63_23780 [Rhodoferax sp.]|nr:hypothetical protein [Rhodoferax sp.]